jgi:excisionase family DNA binding protein
VLFAVVDGMDTPQYLSAHQLHLRWGLHTESVRRMTRSGRLPAIRIGKRLRIRLADVEAYESANRIQRRAAP